MFEVRPIGRPVPQPEPQKETPTSQVGASNNKGSGTTEASMIAQKSGPSLIHINLRTSPARQASLALSLGYVVGMQAKADMALDALDANANAEVSA